MNARKVLFLSLIVILIAGVGLTTSQSELRANPSVGDQIHQITVPVSGIDTFCSIGLAFDGTSLYYDRCGDPNIYRVDPVSGTLADIGGDGGVFNPGILENPNALAFDRTRNGMWIGTQRSLGVSAGFGCGSPNNGMPIYFWDFDDNSLTQVFVVPSTLINPATGQSFVGFCFIDGLAFDANDTTDPDDDELWFSDDVNRNVGVFKTNGTFLRGFDGSTVDPSLGATSGLAVGGQFLYLANDGSGDVFRADKTTDPLTLVDQFTSGDTRQEDMECDPVTFAPTEVMWVRTTPQGGAFPDVITAYEIETGSCGLGGALVDTDGDGLFDEWEINGYDFDGDGNPDVDLPAMGADPERKDIFVEIDWMDEPGSHNHRPNPDAIQMIIDAFDDAPVDCKPLDPADCKGIALHVDFGDNTLGQFSDGEAVPHQDVLGPIINETFDWTDFDAIKADYFAPERHPIFHYVIFAHSIHDRSDGECGASGLSRGFTGQASSDFIVALGGWFRIFGLGPDICETAPIFQTLTGNQNQQAGLLMHELGHNLGLQHGGGEDNINHKPNYLSVMNDSFTMRGLIKRNILGIPTEGHFDYSRFFLGVSPLDEASLHEQLGLMSPGIPNTFGTRTSDCAAMDPQFIRVNAVNDPIDWNCNGTFDPDPVQADINGSGDIDTQLFKSWPDWLTLKFDGGLIGLGPAGQLPNVTTDIDELTAEEAGRIQPLIALVPLDIKPGSDPNSINCNNENEVIAVAMLTTDDFDATTVDHETVIFEGASETHVNKKAGEPRRHEEDVDTDGDVDLVFHFRLGDTILTCESTQGTLTGQTSSGQAIEATDAVRMIDGGGGTP